MLTRCQNGEVSTKNITNTSVQNSSSADKRNNLWKNRTWILHQDNVHNVLPVKSFLTKYEIPVLEHHRVYRTWICVTFSQN